MNRNVWVKTIWAAPLPKEKKINIFYFPLYGEQPEFALSVCLRWSLEVLYRSRNKAYQNLYSIILCWLLLHSLYLSASSPFIAITSEYVAMWDTISKWNSDWRKVNYNFKDQSCQRKKKRYFNLRSHLSCSM